VEGQAVEDDLRREAAVLMPLLGAEDIHFLTLLAAFHAGQQQVLVALAECLLGLAQERLELALFRFLFWRGTVLRFENGVKRRLGRRFLRGRLWSAGCRESVWHGTSLFSKTLGIAESTLSRFMAGGGLCTEHRDALAELLDLHLAASERPKKKG
jgi:hypothetical protein